MVLAAGVTPSKRRNSPPRGSRTTLGIFTFFISSPSRRIAARPCGSCAQYRAMTRDPADRSAALNDVLGGQAGSTRRRWGVRNTASGSHSRDPAILDTWGLLLVEKRAPRAVSIVRTHSRCRPMDATHLHWLRRSSSRSEILTRRRLTLSPSSVSVPGHGKSRPRDEYHVT